jgi:hypothetical protein
MNNYGGRSSNSDAKGNRFLSTSNFYCIAICEGTAAIYCFYVSLSLSLSLCPDLSCSCPDLICVAVINSSELRRSGDIWVQPNEDHVVTRTLSLSVCVCLFRSLLTPLTHDRLLLCVHVPEPWPSHELPHGAPRVLQGDRGRDAYVHTRVRLQEHLLLFSFIQM